MQASKNFKIGIILLSLLIFGCGKNNPQKGIDAKDSTNVKKEIVSKKINTKTTDSNKSFAVSCGAGCAMSYTPGTVTKYISTIKVRFNVEMYINQSIIIRYLL